MLERHFMLMLRRAGVVLCVLAVIAGCKTPKQREDSRAEECAGRVEGLHAWLAILENEGTVRAEQLPSRNGNRGPLLRAWGDTRLVPLDQKSFDTRRTVMMTLDGGRLHYLDREVLPTESGVLFGNLHPGDESFADSKGPVLRARGYISLRIGKDEPWGSVVDVLSTAYRYRFGDMQLVFAGPTLAKPPKQTRMDSRFRETMLDERFYEHERMTKVGELASEMNPACVQVARTIRGQASADRLTASFVTDAPEAVQKCGCDVDFDSIRTFAWYRSGRFWGETTTGKTLVLGDKDATHRITLAKDMKWEEAARHVLAAIDAEPADTPFALAVR